MIKGDSISNSNKCYFDFLFFKKSWKMYLSLHKKNIKGLLLPKKKIVINYSPSCHSKPIRSPFTFENKLRYFWSILRALWPSKDSRDITTINIQKLSKEIGKIIHVTSGVQSKMALRWRGGNELLNKVVIFVFFAYKKYSRSFIKLRLNPWCHMDYFTDLLATFLDVDRGNIIAVYGRVRELSECINIS